MVKDNTKTMALANSCSTSPANVEPFSFCLSTHSLFSKRTGGVRGRGGEGVQNKVVPVPLVIDLC